MNARLEKKTNVRILAYVAFNKATKGQTNIKQDMRREKTQLNVTVEDHS